MSFSVKNPPPCIIYAKEHGPSPDDGMAWCINLGKWFRITGFSENKAANHISGIFDKIDSIEELDAEEITLHAKNGFNSDIELSCKELMGSDSFRQGCTGE